jgi:hypothetical protein
MTAGPFRSPARAPARQVRLSTLRASRWVAVLGSAVRRTRLGFQRPRRGCSSSLETGRQLKLKASLANNVPLSLASRI